jgi:hypothetical protein
MAIHHKTGKQLAPNDDALAAVPRTDLGVWTKGGSTPGAQPLTATSSPEHLAHITAADQYQAAQQPERADKPKKIDDR